MNIILSTIFDIRSSFINRPTNLGLVSEMAKSSRVTGKRRPLYFSDELKKRAKHDAWIVIPVILATNFIPFFGWWQFDHSVTLSPDTQRFLYSSLMQAYASLAGLLLVLMGFLYERIREGEKSFLLDAEREAGKLSIQDLATDYDPIRRGLGRWRAEAYPKQVRKIEKLLCDVLTKYADPKQAKEDDTRNLQHESRQLSTNVDMYTKATSCLRRFRTLDSFYREEIPADFILAVVSTLAVVLMSLVWLSLVEYLSDLHLFLALTTVIVAFFSTRYVVQLLRDVLHVIFGIGYEQGFEEPDLKEPSEAREILSRVDNTMGW